MPRRDLITSTYRFTVLTPTRNRAHVLHRVFDSLTAQTFRDFEWLIVDNGSTDGTADLVAGWQASAGFPIRYIVQENAGVHASWNRGVDEARGTLLLEIRSADTFVPDALERFIAIWTAIPEGERSGYSGVSVNCEDEHGRLIGTEFPKDILDSDSSEIRYRYHVKGEKWGFQRMDVMREHPMPVVDGYIGYIPEAIVWRAIGRRYKTRYVNERLRVYWQDQALGISRLPIRLSATGGLLEAESLLNLDIRWLRWDPIAFMRMAVLYVRCSFHVGRSIPEQVRRLKPFRARVLWVFAAPVGWLCYLNDRRHDAAAQDAAARLAGSR